MAAPAKISSADACKALATQYGSKVAFPGNGAYSESTTSYFSALEGELQPTCIVRPVSTQEVAAIVKSLADGQTPFAIRGGGHNLNGGAANINDGVTIDLRALNSVTIDKTNNLVKVSGGAIWSEVYSVLEAAGLSTTGGRVSSVGVGGLLTGGGISYFSGRKGLACDNIVNYEVVLASGKIVNANSKDNQSLFRALKGGSSNFGIVTRFDLKTFTQGKFLGGVIVYPIDTVPDQLKAFANLITNFDQYAAIIISFNFNAASGWSVFSNIEYTKEGGDSTGMSGFTSIQPQYMNTMRTSTQLDFVTEAAQFSGASGVRTQFAVTVFGGGLDAIQEVYSIWNSSVATVSSIAGISWSMSIQPFPEAYSSFQPPGGNALGISPSDGPATLFLLTYAWANKADDATVTAAAQDTISKIDAAMKKRKTYHQFKYLNYAAAWQNPLASYNAMNLLFLKGVALKYDPTGVFQKVMPGGFKVSKA
ncbi:FAD-binding domain-containing protein [Delitschia confertaspora ATCC 74209]|uniref:FAD-binding domain-containing protein n=1 Tax=Delitschia confertaspora ATCC 74209 TaxID=1513339 RepID=A0A9P4MQR0_9PLEO|nr:FAD-binding domain-containing protein [Delitschia confertaspora ATCC 74209]